MSIRTAVRVDVAVDAVAMYEAMRRCKHSDAHGWPWSIISTMKDPKATKNSVVHWLLLCGSMATEEYVNSSTLGTVMYHIARIENLLRMPPTKHGREGYPNNTDIGSIGRFMDRAVQEFAALDEFHRLAKEEAHRRYLEQAAATSPEYAAHAVQAAEYWGDELVK